MLEALSSVSGEHWIKFATTALLFFIGLFKLLPYVVDKVALYHADKQKNRVEVQQISALRTMARMFDLMDSLTQKHKTLADRVIIFSGHNGGSMPEAGKPYFVSAIHSTLSRRDAIGGRPEDAYRLITVDGHYVRLLLETYENGYVHLRTDNMPECMLQDFYIEDSVKEALVFFIKTTGNHFIYASVANTGALFSESDLREIKRVMNLIKTVMRDT